MFRGYDGLFVEPLRASDFLMGQPRHSQIRGAWPGTSGRRWEWGTKSTHALAKQARIKFECASGGLNIVVAPLFGVAHQTVGKWRARFLERRLDGLLDETAAGRDAPRRATPRLSGCCGYLGERTDGRHPRDGASEQWPKPCDLSEKHSEPDLMGICVATPSDRGFQTFQRTPFIEKLREIVGLYRNLPERALVLCVDEKAQIQALVRS